MAIRAPDGANKIHMQSQRRKSNNGEYSNNPLQSGFVCNLVYRNKVLVRFSFLFEVILLCCVVLVFL